MRARAAVRTVSATTSFRRSYRAVAATKTRFRRGVQSVGVIFAIVSRRLKKIPTHARRAGVFMTKREFSLGAGECHTKLRDARRSTRARSEAVDRSRCDNLSQRCGGASRRLTAQRARNLRSNRPAARRASFTSIEARRLRPALQRGALDSRVETTDKISSHIAQASGVRETRPWTRKR